MARSLSALFLCLLASLSTVQARGADTSPVATGARVRIAAPRIAERSFIGVLVAMNGDDLLVRREGGADPIAVPRAAIKNLEVSRGPKSKAKGALIGASIGAGAGAILGAAAASESEKCGLPSELCQAFSPSKGEDLAVGALVGAAIGGLVGVLSTHGEKWQTVSPERISVGLLVPSARGVGFRVSMRF